jgi:anti-anti-sigma factor
MTGAADFTVSEHDGVRVVRLALESLLGVDEVNRVGRALGALAEGEGRRLVLDLTNVKYAGSAALGMLLDLSSSLAARGGRLVLSGAGHIESLLRVTRAREVLQTAPDTPAAIEAARA